MSFAIALMQLDVRWRSGAAAKPRRRLHIRGLRVLGDEPHTNLVAFDRIVRAPFANPAIQPPIHIVIMRPSATREVR